MLLWTNFQPIRTNLCMSVFPMLHTSYTRLLWELIGPLYGICVLQLTKSNRLETTLIFTFNNLDFTQLESKTISPQVVLHFLKDNRANEIGNQRGRGYEGGDFLKSVIGCQRGKWETKHTLETYFFINYKILKCFQVFLVFQGPVARNGDNAIHWVNLCPVDNAIGFPNTYPLDSDFSVG